MLSNCKLCLEGDQVYLQELYFLCGPCHDITSALEVFWGSAPTPCQNCAAPKLMPQARSYKFIQKLKEATWLSKIHYYDFLLIWTFPKWQGCFAHPGHWISLDSRNLKFCSLLGRVCLPAQIPIKALATKSQMGRNISRGLLHFCC